MLHSARPPSPSLVSPPGLPTIIARSNHGKQRGKSVNKIRTFVHKKDRGGQGVDIRNASKVERRPKVACAHAIGAAPTLLGRR